MGRHIGDYGSRNGDAPEAVTFDHGGETFTAAAALPGGLLIDIAALQDDTVSNIHKMQVCADFLDSVLEAESAVRFAARFRKTSDRPIELLDAVRIVGDLVAEYTGRPTDGSPVSSVG